MTDSQIPRNVDARDLEATEKTASNTASIQKTLAEKFPKAFGRHVPLAIGSYEKILAALPDVSGEQLSAFLAQWTSDYSYLRRLRHGKPRHGLDGQPCGTVTIEEERHAKLLAYGKFIEQQRREGR